LLGVYLVASAAMQVIISFRMGEATRGQALLFVNGATSLVLGILAFRHISNAVQLLAIAVGVALLFRGMATMVYGISDSDANDGGWTISFGTITAVTGVVLMALPFTSVATLATVVGFCLVVLGVLEIISSYEIRVSKIAFRRRPPRRDSANQDGRVVARGRHHDPDTGAGVPQSTTGQRPPVCRLTVPWPCLPIPACRAIDRGRGCQRRVVVPSKIFRADDARGRCTRQCAEP
jgi:uncharacterized membrane protein HdeD (DUF308 family)